MSSDPLGRYKPRVCHSVVVGHSIAQRTGKGLRRAELPIPAAGAVLVAVSIAGRRLPVVSEWSCTTAQGRTDTPIQPLVVVEGDQLCAVPVPVEQLPQSAQQVVPGHDVFIQQMPIRGPSVYPRALACATWHRLGDRIQQYLIS